MWGTPVPGTLRNTSIWRITIVLGIYLILRYFHIFYWVIFPVNLFVTFIHEFGHALCGMITGGDVLNMQINPDGSGYTITSGGNRAIILAGGYIGSAILGNLLIQLGLRRLRLAEFTLYIISALMLFSAFYWYTSPFATMLLCVFAVSLILFARYTHFDREMVLFLGLSSVAYIIQDFEVGPSSDLQFYQETVGLLTTNQWMYTWLVIVMIISVANLWMAFQHVRSEKDGYDV